MSREDAHKLLGGYATGTLTPAEQQALFEAALEDQELFDALAREQALRDVLVDPAARAQLLAAIDDVPAPWYRHWWRPVPMTVLATALAVVALIGVRQMMRPARQLPMAKLEFPKAPPPVLPPPPEIAPAAPVARPLSLPGASPAPPPPVAELGAKDKKADVTTVAVQGAEPVEPKQAVRVSGFSATEVPRPFAATGNSFLPANTVPVHGTVTDTTGTGINSASVEVKSLTTGQVANASTNEQGEFNAQVSPGQTYQIQAAARGFRVATANSVVPASGAPEPVNLKLEVGSASETVTVTAATEVLRTDSAGGAAGARGGGAGRGGRGGAVGGMAPAIMRQQDASAQKVQDQQVQQAQAAAAPVPTPQAMASLSAGNRVIAAPAPALPALTYQAMRRMPDGSLTEIPADGSVPVGATVILEITPPADGRIQISQRGKKIVNQPVLAMQRFDAALPKFDKKQRVVFDLIFTPAPVNLAAADSVSMKASKGRTTGTPVTIRFNVH